MLCRCPSRRILARPFVHLTNATSAGREAVGLVRPAEIRGPRGCLRGMVHEPDGSPTGTALMLHGSFSSEKVGPARLYVKIARLLSDVGYVVGRFDCYGVGDSDGELEEVSLASELADYEAILDMLVPDSREVCLFSHSGSAQLAISMARRRSGSTSLILLAPTVGRTVRLDKLFTTEQQRVLADGGSVVRKCIPISAEFLHTLQDENVFEVAKELGLRRPPVRASIFYSVADEYVTPEGALRLGKALGVEPVSIKGADHNFLVAEARDVLLDEVRRLSQRWSAGLETTVSTIA
jgi:alpha/beta superfamily hydrolase